MKHIKSLILLCVAALFVSCSDNNDVAAEPVSVTLNFSHSWEGTEVTSADFNDLKFVNENGETISITRLRYLVSDIVFTHVSGEVTNVEGYNLVDVTNDENLSYTTTNTILPGEYTATIRFGFKDEDNTSDIYQDLNVAVFNVPEMLGGGYHYMQFDGTYLNANSVESAFNYHAIRAFDMTGVDGPTDTSIEINIGSVTVSGNTQINIDMDLAEWFANPNTWDLNTLNTGLMMNYDAQVDMNENGATVFSVSSITE